MAEQNQRGEFDRRIYRWKFDEREDSPDIARAFIIRTPQYGRCIDTYLTLADEARRHFPHLKNEDIEVGVVKNSGYVDEHAVIHFTISSDSQIPNSFRECGSKPDFNY